MLTLSSTRPLAKYLKRIGNSTFHINSSYIGLEWIARGKGKPNDMKINWREPSNPKSSADQSRTFLHAAMLGYVFDCTDSYLRLLANVEWLTLSDDQRGILRKSLTRPKGNEYAIWERFKASGVEMKDENAINLAMVRVLSSWRNKVSHEGLDERGEIRIDDGVEAELLAAQTYLVDRYGGLDVQEMFNQMKGALSPRRKEIVALVSAAVNLTRCVDKEVVSNAITSQRELEAVALGEIARSLSEQSGNLHNAVKRLWGTNEKARTRRFVALLQEAHFKRVDCAGIGLADDFPSEFANKPMGVAIDALERGRF